MNFMFQKETEKIQKMLEEQDYVADPSILMSVYLAKTLHKPLLIECPAGVGKTEIAKVMARALETDLIRLQCYEGLDANMALYEWNYQRQLLHIKLDERSEKTLEEKNYWRGKPPRIWRIWMDLEGFWAYPKCTQNHQNPCLFLGVAIFREKKPPEAPASLSPHNKV